MFVSTEKNLTRIHITFISTEKNLTCIYIMFASCHWEKTELVFTFCLLVTTKK